MVSRWAAPHYRSDGVLPREVPREETYVTVGTQVACVN